MKMTNPLQQSSAIGNLIYSIVGRISRGRCIGRDFSHWLQFSCTGPRLLWKAGRSYHPIASLRTADEMLSAGYQGDTNLFEIGVNTAHFRHPLLTSALPHGQKEIETCCRGRRVQVHFFSEALFDYSAFEMWYGRSWKSRLNWKPELLQIRNRDWHDFFTILQYPIENHEIKTTRQHVRKVAERGWRQNNEKLHQTRLGRKGKFHSDVGCCRSGQFKIWISRCK